MAKSDPNQFIYDLSKDHQAVARVYSPITRAVLWSLGYFFFTALAIYTIDHVRPSYPVQLIKTPRFLFEILLGLSFYFLTVLQVFKLLIPGESVSKTLSLATIATGVLTVMVLIASFFETRPPLFNDGGRKICDLEIGIYALAALPVFYMLSKKGVFEHSKKLYFLVGISSAVCPALLMQMACAYQPLHGLIFHGGPVLGIGLLYMLVLRFFTLKFQ